MLEGNGALAAQEGAAHPLGSQSREGSALGQRWKRFPPSERMGQAMGRGRVVVAVTVCPESPELCWRCFRV